MITLTLANNLHESRQQLVVVKSGESVANSAAVVSSSAVNSTLNNDLRVNTSVTPNSVSSLVCTNELISSPSIGTSVEITRKNIVQYLRQPQVDVVNSVAPSVDHSISDRVPAFLSPNVVAPANTEPIPFLNSSSTSTVTQLSNALTTSICSITASAGTRLPAVSSAPNSCVRDIQSNHGLFPFASMQHSYQAMHTKNYTSVQRLNQVMPPSVSTMGQTNTLQASPANTSVTSISTVSSTISSYRPQPIVTKDAKNIKVCPPVSSQPLHSLPMQTSQAQPNVAHPKTSVTQATSQSCTVTNQNSASANVALTSPLLVNLLQSDATSGHGKSSVQPSGAAQTNSLDDSTQKRKPRKSRKSKDKVDTHIDGQTSNLINITQPITSVQTVTSTSSPSPSLKHLPSKSLPQQSGIESQTQFNISQHLISIPISAMSRYVTKVTLKQLCCSRFCPRFPSIHPEAQGQPQVVRAGQMPLRAQLSRPQVSSASVVSVSIASTQIRKPIFVTASQTLSTKAYSTTIAHSRPLAEQKSSPIPNSANIKAVNSSSESNPVSKLTTKTKHLINPFTGLLEPMLSDEEEEERPSSETLFPELDVGSDVGGNSERSLSDAGSNGKDNNHSSDTDSGLGKSGTDVSSQSSLNDVGNGDNTPTHSKENSSKLSVEGMSSDPSNDRLKLKVKIETKNECLKGEIGTSCSSNASLPSRSHLTKQKSSDTLSSSSTSCAPLIDANQTPMTEPRVPPLHISIRGPNSAVVVSNRRESTSELEMKTSIAKKGRGVRTTRAMSVESGLGTECTNLNKNQRKKLQREQRFLSGGGIVTSAMSGCASPPSVGSIVDLKQTLSDSSFAVSLSTTAPSIDTVDSVFLHLPDVNAICAQNSSKNDDNSRDNNIKDTKNSNISSNNCVPLLQQEDNNSSQMCAIPVKTDTQIKTSVQTNEQTLSTTSCSSDSDLHGPTTISNTSATITTSHKPETVPTVHCASIPSSNTINTPKTSDQNCLLKDSSLVSKSTSPTNQNPESSEACSTDIEVVPSEQSISVSAANSPSLPLKETVVTSESEPILPVATLVTVGPLINANSEPIVSKISRMERTNCVTSIPALVNSRDFNCEQTVSTCLHPKPAIASLECLNESTTGIECNEIVTTNALVINKCNQNLPLITSNPVKLVTSETDIDNIDQHQVIVNGEDSNDMKPGDSRTSTPPKQPHSKVQNKNNASKPTEQRVEPSDNENMVNKEHNLVKVNEGPQKCQTGSEPTQSSKNKEEVNLESMTDSNSKSDNNITATGNESEKNESIGSESKESKGQKKDPKSLKCENQSSSKNISQTVEEETIVSKPECKINAQEMQNLELKSSDETVKQPLQIVITTTVPSLTTTTTSAVFPQLKSSSLESGSRVTLITFKSNSLNSPNTSSSSGKTSDSSNSCISSPLPTKTVPFKLLTIPSGSGGITVRSATNKLVELINSTNSSPVSPLSPNQLQSSGSPMPLNTTSPPVRLLVSKMATSGGVSQTGVPVSGNSISQLVVVKSVVVTNPSPSIKLVPAKTAKSSVNTPSLLIPVTQTFNSLELNNTINCEQNSKESSHSVINNEINAINDKMENNHNSNHTNDCDSKDVSTTQNSSQAEPVDLSVQCSAGQVLIETSILDEADEEAIPKLIKTSVATENDLSEDDTEDNILTHSVASDHNYNMKKSSNESLIGDSVINLSNSKETNDLDTINDNEFNNDEFKVNDVSNDQVLEQSAKNDSNSRPNKRKSSENAAELIKACIGVEDMSKKNTSHNCTTPFPVPSGLTVRSNASTRVRTLSNDNEPVEASLNETIETNNLNKNKNLRIRKKLTSEQSLIAENNNCSSDDEMAIKDGSGLSWTSRPRLRTGSSSKNQRINKQNNNNFIKDDKIANRSNEKTKRGN